MKLCITANHDPLISNPESLIPTPDIPFSISPLIDSLKVSVDLLVRAGSTLPEDAGLDRALESFRRVIAAGEKDAEGLGIGTPE